MKKQCFLISPIGKDESDIRIFADRVRSFLKYEVLDELDYECIRADDINKFGIINSDVIASIINSDLVIALLEYDNANVYYELALRHATSKICASIVSRERLNNPATPLPFDIGQERVFKFPREEMAAYLPSSSLPSTGLAKFKNDLKDAISKYNNNQYEFYNPVTQAINKVLLPSGMTMEGVLSHIDDKFAKLDNIIRNWMPEDLKSAVRDMYQNGSAIYISGEYEAFEKLTEMTKTAKHSLRTSRFAPQAIGTSHSDFFEAVCRFGKQEGVTCKRIMCMNAPEKESDVLKTVLDTAGGSMELYLTNRDNNFELVVIDDTCAFLHFYNDDKERRIKSTLFIRGQRVVQEFEKIYDRFVEISDEYQTRVIKCSEYRTPMQIMTDIPKIINEFEKN